MARIAKAIGYGRPGAVREFVPSVCADAPEADRVVVVLVNPCDADRREALAAAGDQPGDPDSPEAREWHRRWMAHLVKRLVREVRNYCCDYGSETVQITDGASLWAHGEKLIREEVASEIMSGLRLEEESKKKSKPSPGSENPAPPLVAAEATSPTTSQAGA